MRATEESRAGIGCDIGNEQGGQVNELSDTVAGRT